MAELQYISTQTEQLTSEEAEDTLRRICLGHQSVDPSVLNLILDSIIQSRWHVRALRSDVFFWKVTTILSAGALLVALGRIVLGS